jgi:hypothetical protein
LFFWIFNHFSGKVTKMNPIGYAALIEAFQLEVLAPNVVSYLLERGDRQTRTDQGRRKELYPPRYSPGELWTDQLLFALKHEGINLEVLSALFQRAPHNEITARIRRLPTGRYTRTGVVSFRMADGAQASNFRFDAP